MQLANLLGHLEAQEQLIYMVVKCLVVLLHQQKLTAQAWLNLKCTMKAQCSMSSTRKIAKTNAS